MGAITVHQLSKTYKQYPSRWARLFEWLVPSSAPRYQQKWALREISFQVSPGQAVGIIGMNGAGKSTLLKLITGAAHPSSGSVHMIGKVAALLELGMGFHPDFTGRQNVMMAGQLLGMSSFELHNLMPEIEAFAEIGEYIDQPVRVYSSGMQMRLAFSIATATRPDILIVDEALSVGDAYFQHKSFERIRKFRQQGTTLLLVSHDKTAIQSICDHAILLKSGELVMEGKPEAVMDYYNAMLAEVQNQTVTQIALEDGRLQTISGTGEASVQSVQLLNQEGAPVEVVDVGQPLVLRIEVLAHQPIPRLVLGYGIKDRLGQVIFGTNTDLTNQVVHDVKANQKLVYTISFVTNLGAGSYSIQTALVSTQTHLVNNYEWRDLATIFTVVNQSKPHFAGCAWLPPMIEIAFS